MLVRCIWRDCTFRGMPVGVPPIDAFWVEATGEEAQKHIFPGLSPSQIAESEQFAQRDTGFTSKMEEPPRNYCFLIARVLSMVAPLPVTFPFSNLWNAYSPFMKISERSVVSLNELKLIGKRYSRKPRKCPACGSKRIAEILYGLIGFSDQLEQDLEAGKIVLGGCCISEDDPAWQCADCALQFYRKNPQPL